MELDHIVVLLATGLGVGFACGLLGIGGCFIMIQVQYWVYMAMGVEAGVAIKIAFGTNLFVVLPTAIRGSLGHHRKGQYGGRPPFTSASAALSVPSLARPSRLICLERSL